MQANTETEPGQKNPGLQLVKNILMSVLRKNETGIFIPLIILIIIIGAINPIFFTGENIINNLRSTSFIFIIGIAMTFVLISAGLDLSVGPILALGGIITSMLVVRGVPIPLCILLGLLLGAFIGLLNATIIVKFNIPPLIVTLGMMYMGKGAVLIITKGAPVFPLPENFNIIGQGSLFGIPYIVILAVILAVVAHITLNRTKYGRAIYAVGGNVETARLSGINIDAIKMSVYVLTGLASSLSGIFMAARLASAQPNSGTGYEMMVIAAVIIGGTSMFGGAGSILGTAIGALLMNVISNGMVLMNVSVYWQNLVVGAIIILAVGMDQFRRRKSGIV